ncbi:transcriptional regulator [Vibrio inusitatus NBRC 102082]|uniref:Transcriptional regulator n=1 Tax=Vibrio inusitatus NBRC 102082 TaxID=1219070 RepID=A0A4Y3HXQ1_9VIBR|nr:EAL domain-containing response regulator [Vibrio inusitatus]GEA51490.1 transcriptional regulator [Vibrio inusitatus NBRC 102082]
MATSFSTILIIEDDQFQRRMLHRSLETLTDAKILLAEDGEQGLALATASEPELILCDLKMPNMDGVTFAQKLIELKFDPKLVFVSSTGVDILDSVVTMAKNQGIRDCVKLIKPISRKDIAQLLDGFNNHQTVLKSTDNLDYQFSRQDLQQALLSDEIQAFYQPHVDALTGKIIGAEALCRWIHPVHGTLSPAVFLPQIKEWGLNYLLCSSMLKQGIKTLANWHATGLNLSLSVNVAPSDMMQADFADRVLGLLDEHNIEGHWLTLEITETEVASNLNMLIAHTARLRIQDVHISIDDFGVGYSSLAHLLANPFNELKIDRYFIDRLLTSKRHHSCVAFIIQLSKTLKLRVVAEGVETKEQAIELKTLGCDVFQGFLFSKPLQKTEFEALARSMAQ